MKNEIKEFIRTFAEEELGAELSEDTDFKESGLDSLSLVVLIAALEDKFAFRFGEDELQPELLTTLDRLAEITEKHI